MLLKLPMFHVTGKPAAAWQLCVARPQQAPGTVNLLHLVANECCSAGAFHIAARAFDALERAEPGDPGHTQGKLASIFGMLQLAVAGKETSTNLRWHLLDLSCQWPLVCPSIHVSHTI